MIANLVLGKGPVGLAVAGELARNGERVVLVDAGEGLSLLQYCNTVESNIDYKNLAEAPRLGLTSRYMWGGACMSYPCCYLTGTDSTLNKSRLQASLTKGADFLGVKSFDLEADSPERKVKFPILKHGQAVGRLEQRYAFVTNDARLLSERLKLAFSQRVRVLRSYVATRLFRANEGFEVELVKSFGGGKETLKATKVFVALGTIETTKLLLASRRYLGITSDYLGCNLSDHLAIKIGKVLVEDNGEASLHFDYKNYLSSSRLWARWSLWNNSLPVAPIDCFVYLSNFQPTTVSGASNAVPRRAGASLKSADINVFMEVPNSLERRLELEDRGLSSRDLSFARVFFKLTENEFQFYSEFIHDLANRIESLPEVVSVDLDHGVDMHNLQTSNHPSGCYPIGADAGIIDGRSLALKDCPGLFAVGAGLLPRAGATHPTFISTSLGIMAATYAC